MQCPKCNGAMDPVAAANAQQAMRCRQCHGLFVPRPAMEALCRDWFMWPDSATTERLDEGELETGRVFDVVDDIDCPVCKQAMAHVAVRQQTHISLEQCDHCQGIFFDAGELTDLRYETFADWIRDRINPPRDDDRVADIPRVPE